MVHKCNRVATGLTWLVLVTIGLLVSGCVGWTDGAYYKGAVTGRATARIGRYSFPLMGARIVPAHGYGEAQTDRNGRYTYRGLEPGHHQVTLQTLHATYNDSVYVPAEQRRPQRLDWNVRPPAIHSETFFFLSGLKNLWVDNKGRYDFDDGELVRWEKSVVTVYFDVDGAPEDFDWGWIDQYWAELNRWHEYVAGRIRFARSWNEPTADIVVRWVPKGSLGEYAGIARHVAYYANGALKRVEIEIDVAYGHLRGLWAHEFAHAMGVGHVQDEDSVMNPYLRPGQRTTFSPQEVEHIRLMYDIPSGVRLSAGGHYFALDSKQGLDQDGALGDEGHAVEAETGTFSGRREHVLFLAPDWIDSGSAW